MLFPGKPIILLFFDRATQADTWASLPIRPICPKCAPPAKTPPKSSTSLRRTSNQASRRARLDKLCLAYLTDELKVKSATIGYAPPGYPPFTGAICTSVNHQVCRWHTGRQGAQERRFAQHRRHHHQGWLVRRYQPHVSRGRALDPVAPPDRHHLRLHVEGIEQVRNGATLGDIGHAIQKYAEAQGFSVVREFCGHGIGQRFHEDPQVLHYGKPGTGVKLVTGMLFTVEPMINAGRREIRQLADGWTVVTRDHSLSAQWGAHGAGHRYRLRSADGLARHARPRPS